MAALPPPNRALQDDLVRLLERRFDPAQPLAGVADLFEARSRRHRDAIAGLKVLENEGRLGVPLTVLTESYVHMHLNRLFRAEQNLHEVVIYDFLVQLYTRTIAYPDDR